jgi:hypothetical protein
MKRCDKPLPTPDRLKMSRGESLSVAQRDWGRRLEGASLQRFIEFDWMIANLFWQHFRAISALISLRRMTCRM